MLLLGTIYFKPPHDSCQVSATSLSCTWNVKRVKILGLLSYVTYMIISVRKMGLPIIKKCYHTFGSSISDESTEPIAHLRIVFSPYKKFRLDIERYFEDVVSKSSSLTRL